MKHGAELVYPPTEPVDSSRLLVCGGRDFDDAGLLDRVLTSLHPELVIHGAARGADTLADEWALTRANVMRFPADWKAHGRSAGPRRNARMLEAGRPTLVVAFPGGRGTEDMVQRSLAAGVTVVRIRNGSEAPR